MGMGVNIGKGKSVKAIKQSPSQGLPHCKNHRLVKEADDPLEGCRSNRQSTHEKSIVPDRLHIDATDGGNAVNPSADENRNTQIGEYKKHR